MSARDVRSTSHLVFPLPLITDGFHPEDNRCVFCDNRDGRKLVSTLIAVFEPGLDMQAQVEDGKQDLVEWIDGEKTKEELARRSDSDPYVDPFGEDVTGFSGEDSDRDYDDEIFTKE